MIGLWNPIKVEGREPSQPVVYQWDQESKPSVKAISVQPSDLKILLALILVSFRW